MRILVVGAGVIGLLTAVEAVRAGHRVTVVEQGALPHPRASSWDRHRVVRALHPHDADATAAGVMAHRRWCELEDVLSTAFYHRVGALTVLPPRDADRATTLLAGAGGSGRVLRGPELARRYPHLRLPDGAAAVLESDAGVLLARHVLAACVGWLRCRRDADLRPFRAVARVDGAAGEIRLADGEALRADGVVVAAGPWSDRLLPAESVADVQLYRQSVVYCRPPVPWLAAWEATPAVPSLGTAGGAWLVPPVGGTPLKLSAASACRAVARMEGGTTSAHWRDHLAGVFTSLIEGFGEDWVTDARDCYYLARASGGPKLCVLGPAAVAYAACGGVSFKFAPRIARSLLARATGRAGGPGTVPGLDRHDPVAATEGGRRSA